jgi:diguanylate cyclase (GGDEF)-like protein
VVNSCVSLLFVTLLVVRPTALPLLGVVAALCLMGYRLYVSLSREHARMRLLYRFVGSTGRGAELDEVVPAVLSEAAHLLHAEHARLVAFDDPAASPTPAGPAGAEAGRRARARAWTWTAGRLVQDGPLQQAEDAWWEPACRGEAVLLTAPERTAPGRQGPRDGVAVPMMEAGVAQGVLMVFDRAFEQETFSAPDVRVLETMAAHAAVALDRSRAVERLRRVAEERAFAASHDQLTGLPNRRALQEAVEAAMAQEHAGVVALLDLDDFKDVNDTLGHSAGDGLLRVTGQRLAAEHPGMVARLGGDEFAVLLPGLDADEARGLALRLQDVVSLPVRLSDVEIVTTTTVGLATYQGASCTAEELLARAEVALYAAKSGRSGVQAYRPQDGDSTARRLALAADLPVALREGRLELYYQPQADSRTGVVTGFEALLRWNHPRFGMVPPPEVVAVAQRTGTMPALSAHVLERALRDRRHWSRSGHDLDVSVNLTPRDLTAGGLTERVATLLHETQTPPGALVLEITETDALQDQDRSTSVLQQLSALGIRLSIDDFGTGYSSLSYLDRLPVHEVKIDRSFVLRLEHTEDPTIMRATIALAHDLGLRVVAEGVESDLTRRLVTELGCDLVQGYGLARPMPSRDVLGWLQRRARFTHSGRDALPALA